MNRNVLYALVGALIVAVAVLGYAWQKEREKKAGIEINLGKSGISVQTK